MIPDSKLLFCWTSINGRLLFGMTVPAAHPKASIREPKFNPAMFRSVWTASALCTGGDYSACAETDTCPDAKQEGALGETSAAARRGAE